MARRPRTAGPDPLADLDKKADILERELRTQRSAMDRLKQIGPPAPRRSKPPGHSTRKTA
jgi:hypothetical protein